MFEFKNVIWAVIIGGGGLAMALKLFEFEKVIWGAFLSVFTLTATAFFAMCIFVIGSHVGFANTSPSWGDIFTFGAILVAAITAYIGWKRADKNQRDFWNQADEKQKEASSKNAAVQAIILYAGFAETIDIAFEILDTIKFTPMSLITREDQQDYIRNEIDKLLPNITRNFDFSSAAPLLQDDIFIGERYIVILQYLRSLENVILLFVGTNFLNETAQLNRKNKVITDELHIARLTLQASVVLLSIDVLRGALSKTPTAQDSNISSLNIRRHTLDSAFRHVGRDPEPELTDAENYRNAIDKIGKTASQTIDVAEKEFTEILGPEI